MPLAAPFAPVASAPVASVPERGPAPTPTWWRASTRDALLVSLLLVVGLWAYPHGVTDLGSGLSSALTRGTSQRREGGKPGERVNG